MTQIVGLNQPQKINHYDVACTPRSSDMLCGQCKPVLPGDLGAVLASRGVGGGRDEGEVDDGDVDPLAGLGADGPGTLRRPEAELLRRDARDVAVRRPHVQKPEVVADVFIRLRHWEYRKNAKSLDTFGTSRRKT